MPGPRIRTLKPEIWVSPQIMDLSREARLFFIALITQADDEGRGITEPRKLKATIYAGDSDMTVDRLNELLKELENGGLIRTYETGQHGRLYQVLTWKKHQKVNRAKPSAYPAEFSDASLTNQGAVSDASLTNHRGVTDTSVTHHEGSDPRGIRSDRQSGSDRIPIRSDSEGASPSPALASAAPAPRPAALTQLLREMKAGKEPNREPVLREMDTAEPKAQPKMTDKQREEAEIRADAARLQAIRRRAGLP